LISIESEKESKDYADKKEILFTNESQKETTERGNIIE